MKAAWNAVYLLPGTLVTTVESTARPAARETCRCEFEIADACPVSVGEIVVYIAA
jgi:hypothetical protein